MLRELSEGLHAALGVRQNVFFLRPQLVALADEKIAFLQRKAATISPVVYITSA
jgi:hypothetical protein